jgi:hypothetical protein
MIQIKPRLNQTATCPHCGGGLAADRLLWQGMHVGTQADCQSCGAEIFTDLAVGHAHYGGCQVDAQNGKVWGSAETMSWLGQPLLRSLQNPNLQEITIQTETFKSCRQVIVLNCIDFLYGHSLLKLLNAQTHLDHHPEYGLIVIVPPFLRWMVPPGVAEIWQVDIPLRHGQSFYPHFDRWVNQELQRFDQVYVSKAYSHPAQFDITRFTQVAPHDFADPFRITFIWREDRLWIDPLAARALQKIKQQPIALHWQNQRLQTLFQRLRQQFPQAQLTVTGLGQQTQFPDWIDDRRVQRFTADLERQICQVHRQSRLVIGIHGSNLLLPSAHAGMSLDLMPDDRWGNIVQDILYQEPDPRRAAYRYRYIPAQTPTPTVAAIATSMIDQYPHFIDRMAEDAAESHISADPSALSQCIS